MAGKQAESVIKNIIKEITIESSRKGQNVSETLAAFMVRLYDTDVLCCNTAAWGVATALSVYRPP